MLGFEEIGFVSEATALANKMIEFFGDFSGLTQKRGNLTKATFQVIWEFQAVIDNVRSFDIYEECKFRCAFDDWNLLLNDYLHMDRNHINFIKGEKNKFSR